MRLILTAKQTLTPQYERTLQRLVNILGVVSKNPSNPNFDQYLFESISALLRYVLYAPSPVCRELIVML
jgi:exportin-2 (importin alpha re-exporter)